MSGTLYGVSVGPGDPELMTLKAVKAIRSCEVLAVPRSSEGGELVALGIARRAVPEIEGRAVLELLLPMTRDRGELEATRAKAAETLAGLLREGKNVAFLTLGDVSIYSTYMYLHRLICKMGLPARMIPGVPSFCAAAARLGESLADNGEPLHIIPASYRSVDAGLDCAGTRVLMKSGKAIEVVKEKLRERGLLERAKMVQRCGMEGERVYDSLEEAGPSAGYFSIIVVKDREGS